MKLMVLAAFMSSILSVPGGFLQAKNTGSTLPPSTFLNISYGPDAKQVLDIYLPEGRSASTTRVIFLIHGGSWSSGDKNGFKGHIDSLRSHLPEYALVNLNYRLANYTANKFPTQENDVRSAIEFILRKAPEYNISNNIVLLGASAGAHLALLHAYKYKEPVPVKAVVSFFGPTDFTYMFKNPVFPQVPMLLQLLLGGTPTSTPEIYKESSPLSYASSTSCPTLLFQGGKDPLVSPRQAELLKEKLDAAGVVNELIMYPNEGHSWRGASLSDSFDKITRFLRENVK